MIYLVRRNPDRSLSTAVCETDDRAAQLVARGWRQIRPETYMRLWRHRDRARIAQVYAARIRAGLRSPEALKWHQEIRRQRSPASPWENF